MRIRIGVSVLLGIALMTIASTAALLPASAEGDPLEYVKYEKCSVWESAATTGTLETSRSPTNTIDLILPFGLSLTSGGTESEGWFSEGMSLSDLSSPDQEYCLGVPLEVLAWEEAQAQQRGVRLAASYDYPSRLDWRDVGGRDWTTPVRDQASCGSCVAFGTAAAIESRLEIAYGDPELDPDLSEAHLFFCGSGRTCVEGWYPSAAMDFARDTGVADEACYPYEGVDHACGVCPDWETRVVRLADWIGLTNSADMKQTLADQGPFEVVMAVYTDFYFYEEGVYRHTWGKIIGAHAVTLVGYDDEEGYWVAKNSWGQDWGENGWFRIAYGECYVDNYAYVPIVEPPAPLYHLLTSVDPTGYGMILLEPTTCGVEGCESGTEVLLTAVAEEGYEFSEWGGDISGDTESILIVMDSDMAVTASFAEVNDVSGHRLFVPLVVQ